MSELDSFRDNLIQFIDGTLNLVRTINSITSSSGSPTCLNTNQRDTIIEWAFVNLHAEWEHFIESSFLQYMLGVRTDSGYQPARYVFPVNETHALDLILAGKQFFQWTIPSQVNRQSGLCFENGEPFRSALESSTTELNEITTIRNAIVHKSTIALGKFDTLVRLKLKTLPSGITPGIFLAMIKPKTKGTTFLRSYCSKLNVIAKRLIK